MFVGCLPNNFTDATVSVIGDYLSIAASILSITGSALTIILFFVDFWKTRRRGRGNKALDKLHLCFLAVPTMLGSVMLLSYLGPLRWISGNFLPLAYCSHLRPWAEGFFLCSFLWTSVVALHIAYRVTRTKATLAQTILEHIICWGFPGLFIVLSFTVTSFWLSADGLTEWCDLNPLAEMLFWWVPLTVCIAFDFLVTGYILIRIHKDIKLIEKIQIVTENVRRRAGGKLQKRLFGYLAAFLICWLPGLIARIWSWADPDCLEVWLFYLQRTTYPLQGALNFFVYAFDYLPACRSKGNTYTSLSGEEQDSSWLFSSRRARKSDVLVD